MTRPGTVTALEQRQDNQGRPLAYFQQHAPQKYMIGWTAKGPDARLLGGSTAGQLNVRAWERYLPFDGVVIDVNQDRFAGRYGGIQGSDHSVTDWDLGGLVFSGRRADPGLFTTATRDLQAFNANARQFKHNFLLVPFYTGAQWFSDKTQRDSWWNTTLGNIRLVAKIAKEGGCEGILLDTEDYYRQFWNFLRLFFQAHETGDQRTPTPADAEEWAARVQTFGSEFMAAINAGWQEGSGTPRDCQIMLTFGAMGYTPEDLQLRYDQIGGRDEPQTGYYSAPPFEEGSYYSRFHSRSILLAPFVDGLLAAAGDHTTVTDGCEQAYHFTPTAFRDFQDSSDPARHVNHTLQEAAYSRDPSRYVNHIRHGFGLIISDQFSLDNARVTAAKQFTDRYVWIYNEGSKNFWAPLLASTRPDGRAVIDYVQGGRLTQCDGQNFTDLGAVALVAQGSDAQGRPLVYCTDANGALTQDYNLPYISRGQYLTASGVTVLLASTRPDRGMVIDYVQGGRLTQYDGQNFTDLGAVALVAQGSDAQGRPLVYCTDANGALTQDYNLPYISRGQYLTASGVTQLLTSTGPDGRAVIDYVQGGRLTQYDGQNFTDLGDAATHHAIPFPQPVPQDEINALRDGWGTQVVQLWRPFILEDASGG